MIAFLRGNIDLRFAVANVNRISDIAIFPQGFQAFPEVLEQLKGTERMLFGYNTVRYASLTSTCTT